MKILARILATITQHPREMVKAGVSFRWSNQSIIFNIIRVWEVVFGVPFGIKREFSAGIVAIFNKENPQGIIVSRQIKKWSFENRLVSKEIEIRMRVREFFSRTFSYEFVTQQVMMLNTGLGYIPIGIPHLVFAIASGATPVGKTQGSTATISQGLTITGSNPILFAGEWTSDGDHRSGVTPPSYNVVNMTLVNKGQKGAQTQWNYIDYLINPATGVLDTYLFTATGVEARIEIALTAYSGAKQSGVPDNGASGASVTNGSTVTTLASSVTSTTPSCWAVLWDNDNWNPVAAGTNSTLLVDNHGTGDTALFDSNGPFSAGSFSMTITTSGAADNLCTNMVCFAPAATFIAAPLFIVKQAVKRSNSY